MSLRNAYTNPRKVNIEDRSGKLPRLSDDEVAFAQAVLPPEYGGILYAYDKQDLGTSQLHNKTFGELKVYNGGTGSRSITTKYAAARNDLASTMSSTLPVDDPRRTVNHPVLPFNLTHLYGDPLGGEGPDGLAWEARKGEILDKVRDREAALDFVANHRALLDEMYQAKKQHLAAINKTEAAVTAQSKTERAVIRAAIVQRQKKDEEQRKKKEAVQNEGYAKDSLIDAEQKIMAIGGEEALQLATGPLVTWYQMEEIQKVYSAMYDAEDFQEVLQIIHDGEPGLREIIENGDDGRNIKISEDLSIPTLVRLLDYVRQPRIFNKYGTNRNV
ncbi:MAG: hypothetical protein M1835_001437 [Candelina submexicana]|nr:MAG: hypothetical protein M1835_001437 [Candelina submexicana]